MKFFLPRRPDRDEAEQAYEQLVKRAATEAGQPIKPERYHAIVYSHNGQARRATVGEAPPLGGPAGTRLWLRYSNTRVVCF